MDAVRCYIGKSQTEWDVHLQQIASALRSAVNRQTGFTPNRLMLGREVTLPVELVYPVKKAEAQEIEGFVAELVTGMSLAHETARDTLETSQKRAKRDYDLRVRINSLGVGDPVYILDTACIKGKCAKLKAPWKGPGVIVAKITPYIYRVKERNTLFTANHDRLKLCRDTTLPVWIQRLRRDPSKLKFAGRQENGSGDKSDEIFCTCRKPYRGEFMIQCDNCLEWYHGTCVGITPREAVKIKKYRCLQC